MIHEYQCGTPYCGGTSTISGQEYPLSTGAGVPTFSLVFQAEEVEETAGGASVKAGKLMMRVLTKRGCGC